MTSQQKTAMTTSESTSATLTARQLAIVPIAALAAVGDIARLGPALNRGLDAGLTINDAKEVLVQLYAYAGFPRSLNALGELMKVVAARKQRGLQDLQGRTPVRPIPKGDALLAAGTANQTKLIGAPAKGPLFDFAPAADEYLKSHLFGDIFERDNLDWQCREIATVGMLAAIEGVEPQLQSHVSISLNVGITADQLRQVAAGLADGVGGAAGTRVRDAVERQLAAQSPQPTDRR
jgi:4-carboxymuconolactone decarboxylase